tara:strand:+ start:74634 stop:75767 length:1134 start_codon:yes stop_codon:yes gene_type:complete
MKKAIASLIGVVLIASACTKDTSLDQAEYSDNPLFYFSGSVNGLPVNVQAGKDGYAMYTHYFLKDSVLHMESILAADSPAYREAFKIDIHGGELSNSISNTNYSSSLINGPIALADASGYPRRPHVYDYIFTSDSLNGNIPLQWTTPKGSYYGDSCNYLEVNALEQQSFKVEMQSAGPLSCTPLVAHTILTQGQCKAEMHILKSTNSVLIAEARSRVGLIKSIQWSVNDQNVGTGLTLSYDVLGFSPGYRLKARIVFESGCTETIEKVILAGSPQCDINLNYQKLPRRDYNPHNLGTVSVSYFDANGKEYNSHYAYNTGHFSIESIANYNESMSSGTTVTNNHKRYSFSGDLVLKSSDGSSVQLDNIFGIFAVEHPD